MRDASQAERALTFCRAAVAHGLTVFSGVPCSYLRALMHQVDEDPTIRYLPAVREDAAIGIASGAFLGGGLGGVLIQNSGLGNVVNPLTSFNQIYGVPVLMVVSWRGEAGRDAPEHLIMGAKMCDLLHDLGVDYEVLEAGRLAEQVASAVAGMLERRAPFALIARKGLFG